MTDNGNFGYLSITVTTAADAIPISGATVSVWKMVNGAEENVKLLTTDSNGKTDTVILPTPPKENSLTPNPLGPSYAVYNVRADKDGYYTQTSLNVPVFTAVTSVQPMRMIPLVYGQSQGIDSIGAPYSLLTNENPEPNL